MSRSINRRQFLGQSLAAGSFAAALHVAGPPVRGASPNEKLNVAAVGVAHKGRDNLNHLASQNIIALCDVDENHLRQAAEAFPGAKHYRDYRKMLEAEVNRADAVVVSTADHTHAPATSVALDLGKPVYCEKPLTHTVAEARALAKLAKKNELATQMGTQIHAGDNYRRVVELVQSGAIGPVQEVHCWCNKGWSNGRFQKTDMPAPAHLAWDLWLGPAKERPYSPNIHPSNWRRFWQYGSGTLGDMGCHVMDLPFWALGLRHPQTVTAEGPEIHPDGTPTWCKVRYQFETDRGRLPMTWSDGGEHFEKVSQTKDHDGKPLSGWGLGILFVGEKGMLAADYGRRQLLPQDRFADHKAPPQTIANSMGHWNEWVHAIKTGESTTCNFDYSGALTETVLLGTVAYRSGESFTWDAEALKAKNTERANDFVNKPYRKGFEVVGLDA